MNDSGADCTIVTLVENRNFAGKNAMYRWLLSDPIRFERSLVWTIEHGTDNNFANDYTSVAYWYQVEPHAGFPVLPPVEHRLPRLSEPMWAAERERAAIERLLVTMREDKAGEPWMGRMWGAFNPGCFALLRGEVEAATARFAEAQEIYRAYKSQG